MSKTGQARVLTPEQFAHLLGEIKEHRYPEKNTALVQISFKLGLRVQEIALLQISVKPEPAIPVSRYSEGPAMSAGATRRSRRIRGSRHSAQSVATSRQAAIATG